MSAEGIVGRALGGVAVALRCPTARRPPFARSFSDVDIVIARPSVRKIEDVLRPLSWHPATRFNALNGHSRMLFTNEDGSAHIDIFVGEFRMCHRLDLAARLQVHDETLSLADLLLTKLQVARITRKDVTDVSVLLTDHPLTGDEEGINVPYIAHLLGRDWGWWRTITANLDVLSGNLARLGLETEFRRGVEARVRELRKRVDDEPKSLRWRTRARIGERMPWRDEPEDVERGAVG
jgi:hypothetical protein